MAHSNNSNWVVLKFGGTSVATPSCWHTIASIIKDRIDEGIRPFVVCSALAGVSDQLENLLSKSLEGRHPEVLDAIKGKHISLANELGVSNDELSPHFEELGRLANGIELTCEISSRIRAKVMSLGEIMSTQLGTAYLKQKGIPATWHDARDHLLSSSESANIPSHRTFLQAKCGYERDSDLHSFFDNESDSVIVTQGFIARNTDGETVLLGRGGSDVSASYFAAKLDAARCEIWTDVPGMYTANPHRIPTARLLKTLDYNEAQEIASAGAKVLHPRCLTPLSKNRIPLHIRCMEKPHAEGTVVSGEATKTPAQVKAISSKFGVTLVSMETVDMWHQAGFLADAFAIFKKHGLSVDLVSTSETNITVSLDRATNALDSTTLSALTRDLNEFCQASVIENCAFVSLVGRNIRSILHQLGSVLEIFEEQKIYLLSQAANDLNLTFVVDEDQADRLVRQLHGELFGQRINDVVLGQTWKELFEDEDTASKPARQPWWNRRADRLIELAQEKSPRYIYDEETIDKSLARLSELKSIDRKFYSIKANPYPEILDRIHAAGLGFECVSPGELDHVIELFPGIDPQKLLFTPNFASREEYKRAIATGAYVTLDNLYPIEKWPDVFKGRDIFVRMDPGRGRGHHKYVHTAGTKSKFGVPSTQIEEFAELANKCGARVIGLHAHVGSNIFATDTWSEAALYLAEVAERFPDVKYLDLGGGLGVVEKPGRDELDLAAVDGHLRQFKEANPQFELWMEPGRFVIAEAGVLLARVTQTKHKGEYHYVGIDAGMNTLIRPALYGSYHQIVNLSRIDEEPTASVNIVGPICESGDILGYSRNIAPPQEGDVLLVATTGAYGRVMSCNYNLREPAEEYFLYENDSTST
jgi:diaminopimelate decarboxylase/aspartate kinase